MNRHDLSLNPGPASLLHLLRSAENWDVVVECLKEQMHGDMKRETVVAASQASSRRQTYEGIDRCRDGSGICCGGSVAAANSPHTSIRGHCCCMATATAAHAVARTGVSVSGKQLDSRRS